MLALLLSLDLSQFESCLLLLKGGAPTCCKPSKFEGGYQLLNCVSCLLLVPHIAGLALGALLRLKVSLAQQQWSAALAQLGQLALCTDVTCTHMQVWMRCERGLRREGGQGEGGRTFRMASAHMQVWGKGGRGRGREGGLGTEEGAGEDISG